MIEIKRELKSRGVFTVNGKLFFFQQMSVDFLFQNLMKRYKIFKQNLIWEKFENDQKKFANFWYCHLQLLCNIGYA